MIKKKILEEYESEEIAQLHYDWAAKDNNNINVKDAEIIEKFCAWLDWNDYKIVKMMEE
jgi:hypothetical protein